MQRIQRTSSPRTISPRVKYGHPRPEGRIAVFFRIKGLWVHKGWLMPPLVPDEMETTQ